MIFNCKPPFQLILLIVGFACMLASCTVVKNASEGKFVFNNKIILQGDISKDEKKRLESDLNDYWDDSLKAKRVRQFGVITKIKDPQRFDTTNLQRTRVFMNSYLNSQGYYNAELRDSIAAEKDDSLRITPVMLINPGKRLTIDSFGFDLADTLLQKYTLQAPTQTLLRKGEPFTRQLIATELDRLVAWYRENGYYKISREDLVAHVDTTEGLFDTVYLDPGEFTRKINEALERRKNNPTADVIIKMAKQVKDTPFDSSRYRQYYVGDIIYYPEINDLRDIPDSLMLRNDFRIERDREFIMKYEEGKFIMKPLVRHTYVNKGELYTESNYFRTINSLSQIAAWRSVDTRDSLLNDTVNFHIFLSPAKKYNVQTDFEITRSADVVSSTSFFGLGANVSLLNRNLFKRAIQGTFGVRNGVELNFDSSNILQTIQSAVGISLAFPSHLLVRPSRKNESQRTLLNVSAGYTDRNKFFRLRSFITNLGEEFKRNNTVWSYKFPNIELYSLDTLPQLEEAFAKNPFLRSAFNTGNVISFIGTANTTVISRPWLNKNATATNFLRVGVELAPLGAIKTLQNNFYGFGKIEIEGRHIEQRRKSEIALRQLIGIGYNFSNDPVAGRSLPFFKQFVAGGPNSMRAWNLRRLGLGSSLLSDTATGFTDRFGDLQLETNIEYRFRVATIAGIPWNSALFIDIGNIWNIKNDPNNPKGTFRFNKLFNDLGIAAGAGLVRLDFSYLILRVDVAFKLKDPARLENKGWLDIPKFTWQNDEFPNASNKRRNNYAIQIGIGLPF